MFVLNHLRQNCLLSFDLSLAYGAIAKPSNFSMPTYNRFDKLADENSNVSYEDRSKSQKNKARSPLDSDQTLK